MAASSSLACAFSSAFSPCNSTPQSDNQACAEQVFLVCARAGVSPIGLTSDQVFFRPVVATLSIPLAEFADAPKAIALIKAKLAAVR